MYQLSVRLLGVFSLFALAACSDGSRTEPASNDADPDSPPEVVLIGVDGAEWQVIEDMVERGELPGFARLMDEGAFGHLINPGPQVSPVVWTTFATGHFGTEHGILDFVYPFSKGSGKQPVDVSLRRQPALWNVLDAHDMQSTVIGYFVSWPAEAIDGRIVSDRAFQNLDHAVWPETLEPVSQEVRRSVFREESSLYERFFPWPYEAAQAEDESSPYHFAAKMVEGRVDSRIRSDEYLRRMTDHLFDEPADLLVSYLRIVDIVSHSLWKYYDASDWEEKPASEKVELLGGVLEESYRYADELIQQALETYGGRSNIFVISDHGFGSGTGRYQPRASDLLTGNHRPNGIFLAHGPAIEPGRAEPITIMEIYPTLAYLLDVPISDEIPGSVAYALIAEAFSEERSPHFVERYDFNWNAPGAQEVDADAQAEEMESLRGLGYIGEGVTLADASSAGEFDFWGAETRLLVGNLHGNVVYYLIQENRAAADAATNALKRNAPHLLPQLLARVRAKVHSLRRELPDGDGLAPGMEDFIEAHQGTASGEPTEAE
ncbi:alkaline phosphatase family protein [Wenzhouxiangella sp. XN201]|uniref:alkaline phosphatase family protein n=1 Tax=Wenzhouxiangella sp. XN201 TaxID=2710755 RepID=UPI0013C5C8AB|nr:alkaline phosphatase family protein [Wenzhouxiangella sp. XN201]NEZ04128.1 alkaline phosphatase family protein [Wenzhouxiangella sp. XN201]